MGENFSLNGPSYPTAKPAVGGAAKVDAPAAQPQGWFTSPAAAEAKPAMGADEGGARATDEQLQAPAEPPLADIMADAVGAKQALDVQKILKDGNLSGHGKVDKLLDLARHASPPLNEANRTKAYQAAIDLVKGFGTGDKQAMLDKVSHAVTADGKLPYDAMVSLNRACGHDYGETGAEIKARTEQERTAKARSDNAAFVAEYKAQQEAKAHAPKGGGPGAGAAGLQGYFDRAAAASRAGAQLPFLEAMEGALGACKNQADRELVIDQCMALRNQNFGMLQDYVYDQIQAKASDPDGHDAVPGGQLESYAHTKQGGTLPTYLKTAGGGELPSYNDGI